MKHRDYVSAMVAKRVSEMRREREEREEGLQRAERRAAGLGAAVLSLKAEVELLAATTTTSGFPLLTKTEGRLPESEQRFGYLVPRPASHR